MHSIKHTTRIHKLEIYQPSMYKPHIYQHKKRVGEVVSGRSNCLAHGKSKSDLCAEHVSGVSELRTQNKLLVQVTRWSSLLVKFLRFYSYFVYIPSNKTNYGIISIINISYHLLLRILLQNIKIFRLNGIKLTKT